VQGKFAQSNHRVSVSKETGVEVYFLLASFHWPVAGALNA
jgi:hypothetical protein